MRCFNIPLQYIWSGWYLLLCFYLYISVCLCSCTYSLENALVKLNAEKARMDDLSTRDEANETKFAALQRTLDLLVNGEGKKAMDCK